MELISLYLFMIKILNRVILKYVNLFLPVVDDEASSHLQYSLLYLIMSHMNTVHTFVPHIYTIPCNQLILLCWNILNSHLKSVIPYRPVLKAASICALNRILSM